VRQLQTRVLLRQVSSVPGLAASQVHVLRLEDRSRFRSWTTLAGGQGLGTGGRDPFGNTSGLGTVDPHDESSTLRRLWQAMRRCQCEMQVLLAGVQAQLRGFARQEEARVGVRAPRAF